MKRIVFFMAAFLLTYSIVNSHLVEEYIDSLKTGGISVARQGDALYEGILAVADESRVAPEDAKIDKVWKAIPGYNGLEVDIPASYRKMKSAGKFEKKKLVYKEIKPEVHLGQLPPAPVYKGHPSKPMVSLAVNVAWGNEYLPDMLAVLKEHNVLASFFLEGNWVKKNPELAKMIADAGHEIGNHSYSHADMKKISKDKALEELRKTNEVIKATTGIKCVWFAPPSGSIGLDTATIAAEMGLGTVMWTVDTIDWRKPSPETILNRVSSRVGNGSIILMHPTEPTAKALERMILSIKEKKLKIAPISEMLSEKRAGMVE
ncbi:polysaccharide deacetylase family protein [Bacillus sp. FJAT-27445]|uniref:polysaccharide deacetylase family protein n=1 Tax=Bacillus sp. FJAT-27445 TaxID=1679166 RepID=UPI000A61E15C|nr:polysaccharide deacetylase family protein [Bacillus sp. FJAT-27445]